MSLRDDDSGIVFAIIFLLGVFLIAGLWYGWVAVDTNAIMEDVEDINGTEIAETVGPVVNKSSELLNSTEGMRNNTTTYLKDKLDEFETEE